MNVSFITIHIDSSSYLNFKNSRVGNNCTNLAYRLRNLEPVDKTVLPTEKSHRTYYIDKKQKIPKYKLFTDLDRRHYRAAMVMK